MNAPACRITGIEKSFGPNRVLRKIDLDLPESQVTVLMGANGAGKSTLVKILCGLHSHDAGELTLFGKPFAPSSPADAFEIGVVTVHQSIDDGVIPDLDVASNLLLDRLTDSSARFFLDKRKMRAEAREVAAAMQLDVDVNTPVANLGIADRQMIAIARAMSRNPKLLILDEPTSSLSAAEANRLFDVIDRLRETGVAILYISHRMSDIRRVADRIVAMRDGRISGVFEGDTLDYEGAVTAMLGQEMAHVDVHIGDRGDKTMVFDGLRLSESGDPIDLTIHKNEVVAITGLLGSGKSALAAILFGLSKQASGTISLDGKAYAPGSPIDAISAGVFMCPKDRSSNAVIPEFDITNNITVPFLKQHATFSFLSRAKLRETAGRMIDTLGVVCQGQTDGIETLSGGNQQKVMVARWLSQPSKVLVLDEPFQGVDIKARRDIGDHIRKTAEGRATIVFVSELDEALEIADRIVVLHEHALVGDHINNNIDLPLMLSQYSGKANGSANEQANGG